MSLQARRRGTDESGREEVVVGEVKEAKELGDQTSLSECFFGYAFPCAHGFELLTNSSKKSLRGN